MAFLHVAMRGGRRIPAQFTGLSPGCAHSTPARCTSCPQVIHRLCLVSGSAGPSVGPHPDEGGRRVAGGCQTLLMCCATRTPPRFREDCCVSIAELDVSSYSGRSDGPDDRVPPQDVLAEQSVIGGMLLSKDAVADCVETVKGNDFYLPKHELIFDAILDLYAHGEPTDAITVTDELTKRGELSAGRRSGLPAHADRLGADRGQRRLLRARSSPSGPCCAGSSTPAPASSRWATARAAATSRTSSTTRRPRSTGGRQRGGEDYHILGDVHRGHRRRDRARLGVQRRDDRRAHRLHRPRRAHQRPAPGPDDHHRRATGDR